MKKIITTLAISLLTHFANAQTNLITNGSFEAANPYSNWNYTNNNFWWAGVGVCTAHSGANYMWFGAQNEQSGNNSAVGDLYQTLTIPSSSISCVLDFWASINTNETTTTSEEDYVYFKIRNTSGTLLYSLGSLTNVQGNYGIPGCQTWVHYYANIPSTYFGSTVRISFEFDNDISLSTIFRFDDIKLIATPNNTGTNELKNNLFSIYPNPANDQITIEAKQEMMGKKYEITDNLGRIIIEGKINNSSTTIQLENVAAGVYFFRVNEEGYNFKLIKN